MMIFRRCKTYLRHLLLLVLGLAQAGQAGAFEYPKVVPPEVRESSTDGEDFPRAVSPGHTLAAWNIQWFPGQRPGASQKDQLRHTESVRKELEELSADILFLCEIRGIEELEALGLDYPYMACTDIPSVLHPRDSDVGKSPLPRLGLAILSRIPWEQAWVLDFSEFSDTMDRPPRGVLAARFREASGRYLWIYSVHLKSNARRSPYDGLKRDRALRYIERDWERHGIHPSKDFIIVLGDMNFSWRQFRHRNDPAHLTLREYGFTSVMDGAPLEETYTLPKKRGYPATDFDNILLSPALLSAAPRAPPLGRIRQTPRKASDHWMVLFPWPGLLEEASLHEP